MDNKETLLIGNKGYYNSIGIQFHRKGTCTIPEKKRIFIPTDLTVNIQASCKLYKFDFVIVYYH